MDLQTTQIVEKKKLIEYKEDMTLPTVDTEKIIDWECRIASYPQELKDIYYKGFEKLAEFDRMLTDKTHDWVVKQDSKKKGA